MNSEEIRQHISEIEKLYENARFKEAYGKFNELCSSYPTYRDQSISILASFNDLDNQIIRGNISYEDQTNAKQQIGNRFLMCLRQFKDENLVSPDLSKLISILSETGLSPDELKSCYKSCLPERFELDPKASTLFPIIKHLSDILHQSDNTLPLLIFAQKIAEISNNEKIAEKLNEWTNTFVSEYENEHDVKIKIKPDEAAQSSPIHLLVKLIPDPDNRNQKGHELYAVEIYSWKSPNDVDCKARVEKCLLADVREKLDKMISEFDDDDDIKTIEFILPCELVGIDVDQWVMEEGRSFETKFGKEYPVLARLDRNRFHRSGKKVHPNLRKNWEKRWGFFNNPEQSHKSSVVWLCNHQVFDPKNLCEHFSCSDGMSCLFITFMPSENYDGKGLGHVILEVGIPVALCYRKYVNHIENPESIENQIKSIISGNNLLNLPDLIHKKRRIALQEEDIGNHLTLIWDNPERVLPKKPLYSHET